MCIECLISVDSHPVDNGVQGRVLSAITKDEAMEFAPVGTYPSTYIDVLIVGTGFGGLTAALEFTREGHNVRIIERNHEPDISGKLVVTSSYSSSGIVRCYLVISIVGLPCWNIYADDDRRRYVLHGPLSNSLLAPLARDEEALQRDLSPQRLD
jgi:hypothetical protein